MFHRVFLGKQRGFTIIEILVVITVIGILAGLVMVAYPSYQQSTRDTKRKSDLQTLADAIKTADTEGDAMDIFISLPSTIIPNFNISAAYVVNTSSNLTVAGNVNQPSRPGGLLGKTAGDLGYLSDTIMDPTANRQTAPSGNFTTTITYSGYIRIPCFNNKGSYYFASLERPSAADIASFNNFKDNVLPSSGIENNPANTCFYVPDGENLADGNNVGHNTVRALARSLINTNANNYNYALYVK